MKTLLRVLLVEDSEDKALLLVQELRRGGYGAIHRLRQVECHTLGGQVMLASPLRRRNGELK